MLVVAISACGHANVSNPSSTMDASQSADAIDVSPTTTATTNSIDPSAAKAYEAALNASQASANSVGLTELWSDETGGLATVLVQAPHDGKCVQSDLIMKTAQIVDSSAMMPTVLLDELDGLKANNGSDTGAISSPSANTFVVKNRIDGSDYVTTYTVDPQGRIASAQQVVDDQPSATATFRYFITSEGKAALAAGK